MLDIQKSDLLSAVFEKFSKQISVPKSIYFRIKYHKFFINKLDHFEFEMISIFTTKI